VEPDDVLAHEVVVGRPVPREPLLLGWVVTAVAERGDVVQERIDPHVRDVAVGERERHAPREVGARDREVLEATLHEGDDFVAPRVRLHELGIRRVELEQPLAELRELEEPVVLADVLDLASALRAHAALELLLGPERLVGTQYQPS
jgi:hypothetical protein